MISKHTDVTECSQSVIDVFRVLDLSVAVTSLEGASEYIIRLASENTGGYICAANVHMCMESYDDPDFSKVVNNARLVVPDGKPLSLWMKALGAKAAQQVRGPDLFLKVCYLCERQGFSVALYGGSEDTLESLRNYMKREFPSLVIASVISPPYRDISPEEQCSYINDINHTGAKVLFVGLGCPKQEKWMASNMNDVDAIMIGVGAAFDFYAGTIKIAPDWMRKYGLEWLFRLYTEPGRLWKRYLLNNPRFILLFVAEWSRKLLKDSK